MVMEYFVFVLDIDPCSLDKAIGTNFRNLGTSLVSYGISRQMRRCDPVIGPLHVKNFKRHCYHDPREV
jgi:hypothetical protein